MDVLTIIALAVALAMDAVAVSVASGVVIKELHVRHALRIALFFGSFQAVMPVVGWLAGLGLKTFIAGVDHWVAFGLLTLIGGKMIYEALTLEQQKKRFDPLNVLVLLVLAVATSIDALAVGLSLSLLQVSIILPVIVIGAVTFVLSLVGVYVGDRFGHLFESKMEIVAGLILIAIGAKIVVEHLGGS